LKKKYTHWLEIVFRATQEAGEAIMLFYNIDYEIKHKEDTSPVTSADLASNVVLKKYLEQTNIPVLSEEEDFGTYQQRKDLPLLWIIDPLDGTKEFIGKHQDFAINVALIENNRPILGVIYIPYTKQLFYAVKNEGAFLVENNKQYELPITQKRRNYIFLKSRSHPSEKLEEYIKELKETQPNLEVKIVGSSVKFCEIALGNADEYTRFNPTMEWDTAAGQILVEEVGKSLIDLKTKQPMVYNRENLKNGSFSVK